MRVLDEWLTFVDTDEFLPLFENPNKSYNLYSQIGFYRLGKLP